MSQQHQNDKKELNIEELEAKIMQLAKSKRAGYELVEVVKDSHLKIIRIVRESWEAEAREPS